jgi:hypothetical protein
VYLSPFSFHQGEHTESPFVRSDQLCRLRRAKRATTRQYNQGLEYTGLTCSIGTMKVVELRVRLDINRSQVAEIFYL